MFWHAFLSQTCLLAVSVSGAAIQQQPLQASGLNALDQLKQRVGNRLIDVAPVAKPCYGEGAWDSTACQTVRSSKNNDYWTSNHPAGYFYSNWASCQSTDEACAISASDSRPISANATCHQGTVPPMMINITNLDTLDQDIAAAFEYVRGTNVPLVIKNTGHDWKGRSTAPNSLALWTHQLQHPQTPIQFEKNFTPINCSGHPEEMVFHYGPGQTWGMAYEFAEKKGLSVVGGTCPTVGIAGWFQGGGHSPVSPLYGLGIDNLLQLEVVTPKRGKLIVNECTEPDLWFAIRGGGAGSFGIVTKITYRALKREVVQDLRYKINPMNSTDMREYLNILTSNAPEWSRKGWGGYIKSLETGAQVVELAKANSTRDEAEADMKCLFEFLDKRNVSHPILCHDSWPRYVSVVETNHPAGWSMNVATRLVPSELLLGSENKTLVNALMDVFDAKLNFWLMLVAPTRYRGRVVDAAIHPTWRNATMLVRVMDKWDLFKDTISSTAARSHYETLRKNFEPIRKLTPDMGTSISESDIWEPDHDLSFWGSKNYERLVDVKNDVDPENLLTNWHAVNWEEDHPRYKCYPKQKLVFSE